MWNQNCMRPNTNIPIKMNRGNDRTSMTGQFSTQFTIVSEAKYSKMCGEGGRMIKQRLLGALYELPATSFALNDIHKRYLGISETKMLWPNLVYSAYMERSATDGCGGPKHTHNKTAKGNKTGMIVIIHQSELANCLGWMRSAPLSISRNIIPRCSRLRVSMPCSLQKQQQAYYICRIDWALQGVNWWISIKTDDLFCYLSF